MANYTTSLKQWGSQGEEFPDSYNYVAGEQPVDVWDNFLTYNLIKDVQHLVSLTNNRLESDAASSRPTSPEAGHLFYSTGDGAFEWYDASESVWETALPKSGGTMTGGLDMGNYALTNVGSMALSGVINVAGNNIEDAGTVLYDSTTGRFQEAENAQTLQGNAPSAFAAASHNHDGNYHQTGAVIDVTSNNIEDGGVVVYDAATGKVEQAKDSDTLGGYSPGDFAMSGHNHDGTYHRQDSTVNANRLVLPVGTDMYAT